MKNLIKQIKDDNEKSVKKAIEYFHKQLKESQELTITEKHTLNRKTPYKNNRTTQVENRLKDIALKELQIKLDKITSVNNALDTLQNDLVLTINFTKNATWGYCPKGNDNYGHKTDSISGCGYCKESTATGQLLSQNDIILKKMYKVMNKPSNLKKGSRESLGYGSGYGILPSFSGGVGVSCHIGILEKLGYKVTQSGNDTTTILVISEK